MNRLSPVDCSNLTPEQKELYNSIASGPRAKKRKSLVDEHGNLTGPFNAFLHNPALGKHWSAVGETLRFRTKLDRRLFELAILIIAVHWRSGHEWAAHCALARAEGVADDVIAALQGGPSPGLRARGRGDRLRLRPRAGRRSAASAMPPMPKQSRSSAKSRWSSWSTPAATTSRSPRC